MSDRMEPISESKAGRLALQLHEKGHVTPTDNPNEVTVRVPSFLPLPDDWSAEDGQWGDEETAVTVTLWNANGRMVVQKIERPSEVENE